MSLLQLDRALLNSNGIVEIVAVNAVMTSQANGCVEVLTYM